MTSALPRLFSVKQAAEYFGVAVQTIREWYRKGLLRYVKIGSRIRFTESAILYVVRERGPDGEVTMTMNGKTVSLGSDVCPAKRDHQHEEPVV
jgi:excisionase family DNA binding protein